MVDRYLIFETQTPFTNESFDDFGANAHTLDVSGEDITGDQQYIYPLTATGRVKRNRITGPKKFSGPIDCPIFPREATSLIYYCLGSASTVVDSPTTDHNTHTIKKAKTIPFFRAGIGRDQKEHRYVGGIISGMTLDYSPDETFSGSFDTILRRELTLATLKSTAIVFPPFNDVDRAFGGVEVTPAVAGTDVTFVESASVTIENNVAEDAFALGSPYLPAGIVAAFEPSGSFDLRYDNSQRYTDWLTGVEVQFELTATYGSGITERTVKIDLPKISYDVNRLPTENIERFVQTIDFTPEQDSNGDPIIVTVVNSRSNAELAG